MEQPAEGFEHRLRRAIGRWAGGGQRAFADALKAYAEKSGANVPTSRRTLVNYLAGETEPSSAWVEIAAAVLDWNFDYLWSGDGPERDSSTTEGVRYIFDAVREERTLVLNQRVMNRYLEIPIAARWMMFRFLDDYFGDDLEGWGPEDERRSKRIRQVDDAVETYFGPLLSRPRMEDHQVMALAAALTAAAYTRLGANGLRETNNEE